MRLGGPLFGDTSDPQKWVATVRRHGYSAVYCPVGDQQKDDVIAAYVTAAREADIVIAEVGAWSNPLSPDEAKRREGLALSRRRLALADKIGARCCVNISGSRGAQWDGPHPANLTDETFDMIVEMVRGVLDDVKPTRTFYTLETMPWMYPDSTDSYLRLIRAINRPQFAVHFDPVNLICSPQRFFSTGAVICEFVQKLGPHIRSCHAKDIALSGRLTTHLDEVRAGLGGLDYRAFLTEASRLDPDTPIMVEHLKTEEDYRQAVAHIRKVASDLNLRFK
jgi:sugar phosphate isomerase/epimerase